MDENTLQPQPAPQAASTSNEKFSYSPPPSITVMMSQSPAMQELMLRPISPENPIVNDEKLRRLYLQAASQQWFAPARINFDLPVEHSEPVRQAWVRLHLVFYTLEKMGLNVIANMMPKAMTRLRSEEVAFYLSCQTADEARHVFAIETYLKKLGAPPRYDRKFHVLGQVASMGMYRVENWLFSTLFSENFASAFLRRASRSQIDPLGADLCKSLLSDESRHLHFLHIVLPDVMDSLSLFGKTYVKGSQYFIMKFTEVVSKTLEESARTIGIDRRSLLEEVFENVERAYESFGVTRSFLPFPKVSGTVKS